MRPGLRLSLRRSRARGFTVLELLIAAFIAMFIFGTGLTILTGANRVRAETQSRLKAGDSARMFFELLERDLAAANPLIIRRSDLVNLMPSTTDKYYLQMSTTTEEAAGGSEWVLVQYYIPQSRLRKLYRKTQTGAFQFSYSTPVFSEDTDNEFALCIDVEELGLGWARWHVETKQYEEGVSADVATHLDVRLRIRESSIEVPEDRRVHVFRKYIPLPPALW
jgi:type II secretory pathway pseudopilin PulG